MWHVKRKRERGISSNGNMTDGSEWTRTDKQIKTEVDRCHTKMHKGERSAVRRDSMP